MIVDNHLKSLNRVHAVRRQTRPAERAVRYGFTLVELLIVIAIIGVLTSMIVIALADSANEAKISRAKVQVRKLNNRIMEKWEEFETRSIPLRLPNGGERFPVNSSRVRLYMLRALQRLEMPERMSDILFVDQAVNLNGDVTTADLISLSAYYQQVNGVGDPINPLEVPIQLQNGSLGAPYTIPLTAFTNSLNDFYYREVFQAVRFFPSANGRNLTWGELISNQGAECLYLIMKSMQDEYGNALDAFSDSEIGDIDNDGLLEIHDPWGTPISFLRWAPGMSETGPPSTTQTTSPIQSGISSEDPDPFDRLQSDPRFTDAKVDNDTFRLVPFIYCAGPDRQYDIWTRAEFDRDAYDGNDRLVNYSYESPEALQFNDPFWGWGLDNDTVPSVGFRLDLDADGEGYFDNIDNHFGLEE